MASISRFLSLPLFFSLLFIASATSPAPSQSLPPQPPADGTSPPPATPSSAPAPSFSSPPAPPPSDLAPKSHSPAPTPDDDYPSPAPAVSGDVNHVNQPNAGNIETEEKSSGGMSRGQKAGVAIGVIAGACVVGVGALVYKKRRQNIERSQYGYAARREIL